MEARGNISWDPADLDDPRNAPYVFEGPDGKKFVDWSNPGHVMERWADRLKVLATGTPEEIMDVYTQEYYNRLAKRLGIGPRDGDAGKRKMEPATKPTPFPENRPMIDADEALAAMRGMRREIMRLTRERQLLALDAAKLACPEGRSCHMSRLPAKSRPTSHCMGCWLDYAEKTIVKPRRKIVPGTKNA